MRDAVDEAISCGVLEDTMDDDQTCPESVLLVLMERAFRGPTHEGVRILDWQPQLKRVLQCVRENDPVYGVLRDDIERLRAEISTAEAFHKVAVAERNYERQRADILESATIKALEDRDRLRAELAELRRFRKAIMDYDSNLYDALTNSDAARKGEGEQ